MRSFVALVHREYIEHRIAYVFAPAALVALFTAACLYVFFSAPATIGLLDLPVPSQLKLFEVGYGLILQAWWYYALASLFFYYADAFHGDTRNNAMLFWKSMPQSDLKISAAKLSTGLTVFPATLLVAALISGIVLVLPVSAVEAALPASTPLDPGSVATSYLALTAIGLVYFLFGLLWFAPFFAWIALLSTILGRWSIPLAFLIPAVAVVFELLVLRLEGAPDGSYLLSFLSYRTAYGFGEFNLEMTILMANPIDAGATIANMLANLDWVTLVGGLAVAALLLALSAEYRRRFLLT